MGCSFGCGGCSSRRPSLVTVLRRGRKGLPLRRRILLSRPVLALVTLFALPTGWSVAGAQTSSELPPTMTFPVIGSVTYSDTFGQPRSGGRTHDGQDLLGPKMLELVAAADGR